jgi:hypothetical protein
MRASLIYGCLGLISVSSLAGCGLFSNCRDNCGCNDRPVARMVVRNGVVVAQTPTGMTSTATISGSSRPIAAPGEEIVILETRQQSPERDKLPAIPILPVAQPKAPEEPMPSKVNSIPLGQEATKEQKKLLPIQIEAEKNVGTLETIEVIDPAMPSRPENAGNDARAKDKSIALKNVPIQYGHSDDFKSVTGQVQMWRNTVRLRYAPIDQEDQYGGFVVLEGDAELTTMRDGQHVRIRGVLIAPEDRNGAAHYRVQGLEILD